MTCALGLHDATHECLSRYHFPTKKTETEFVKQRILPAVVHLLSGAAAQDGRRSVRRTGMADFVELELRDLGNVPRQLLQLRKVQTGVEIESSRHRKLGPVPIAREL